MVTSWYITLILALALTHQVRSDEVSDLIPGSLIPPSSVHIPADVKELVHFFF